VTFTPGQVAALKKLRELWPDTPFVLVGASALGCFLDFRWRVTNDIDISVSIELDELPAGLNRLPGWSADPRAEHRWLAPLPSPFSTAMRRRTSWRARTGRASSAFTSARARRRSMSDLCGVRPNGPQLAHQPTSSSWQNDSTR